MDAEEERGGKAEARIASAARAAAEGQRGKAEAGGAAAARKRRQEARQEQIQDERGAEVSADAQDGGVYRGAAG